MATYPAIVRSQELCSLQITVPLLPVASSLIADMPFPSVQLMVSQGSDTFLTQIP